MCSLKRLSKGCGGKISKGKQKTNWDDQDKSQILMNYNFHTSNFSSTKGCREIEKSPMDNDK